MGKVQNTWMGDPPRIELLKTVLSEIQKEDLLQLVKDSGEVLLDGLRTHFFPIRDFSFSFEFSF